MGRFNFSSSESESAVAESYNQWLRAKIERAIADARPAIHHDQVVARVRAAIDAASMRRKVAEDRCICSGTLRRLRSCRLRALALPSGHLGLHGVASDGFTTLGNELPMSASGQKLTPALPPITHPNLTST